MTKKRGITRESIRFWSVAWLLGVLIGLQAGCALLGRDLADLPPTTPLVPTAVPTISIPASPTSEAPPPTLPAPLVTPLAVPTITPLPIPSVTPLPVPTLTPIASPTAAPSAVVGADGRIYLGEQLLIDPTSVGGCFEAGEISYSPTGAHFVVVLACFEGDNHAFIFNADGSNRREITGSWDFVNYYDYEWSPDGQSFIYRRINSCCAEPPPDAPTPGRVSYNVVTGETIVLEAAPRPVGLYRVFDVASDDVLNVRSGPGVNNGIVGTIPPNAGGIRITGPGTAVGSSTWVPIDYQGITGWVNRHFLVPE